MASALILSGGFAYLGCYYENAEERATAMGLAFSGVYAGVLTGPVLGGALFQTSHHLPYVVLAMVELLVLLGVVGLLPRCLGQRAPAEDDGERFSALLQHGAVYGPLLSVVISTGYIAALECTTARYAMDRFGWTETGAGAVWLYVTVPTIGAALMSGPLGLRIGRANLLGMAMALGGVSAMLAPTGSLAALVTSLLGAGLTFGVVNGCAAPLLGDMADRFFGGTSQVYALANSAEQLGFVVGPLIGSTMDKEWAFPMVSVAFGALLLTCSPLVCCVMPLPMSLAASHKLPMYGSA